MSRTVSFISLWLGAVVSCLVTTGAAASDLMIKGRASETVELNDNYGLTTGPKSGVLGSYSSGYFSALYKTPTTRFTLNGDVTYRKYFGPGIQSSSIQGSSLNETTSDGLNMRFERDGTALGDRDFAFVSRRRIDASIAQRDDIGFSTSSVKGDLITYSAGAGSSRRLTDTDTLSGSIGWTKSEYSPSSSSTTPFTRYSATGGWGHRVTKTVDFNLATNLGYSIYDNTANTVLLSSQTTGGLTIRLSDRLTISGNAGVAIFKTTQDVAGPVVIVPTVPDPFNTSLFTPAPFTAGTVIGPVWTAKLNYQLQKSTTFTLTAGESIYQGTLGDLAKTTSIAANMNHVINSISTLTFAVQASILEPPAGGPATNSYSGSLSYSHRLSQDWYATATYIHRRIESSPSSGQNSAAASNAVLFVIAKDFVLKP